MDPSVSTNAYGIRSQFGANQIMPPAANPSNFQTNALSNPTSTSFSPLQPINSLNPMQSSSLLPNTPYTPVTPLVPTLSQSGPPQNQTGFNNQIYDQSNGQNVPNYVASPAPAGWNDPPALNRPLKSQVRFKYMDNV